MQKRVQTFSGAIALLLAGLPAWAQTGVASAPDGSNTVHIPDPRWFIAGLITGLVVGAIGARVFGGSKSSTN